MTEPKVPPGDERVARGEKSKTSTSAKPETSTIQKTENPEKFAKGEKPGKQTQAEHDKIAVSGKHTIKAGDAK